MIEDYTFHGCSQARVETEIGSLSFQVSNELLTGNDKTLFSRPFVSLTQAAGTAKKCGCVSFGVGNQRERVKREDTRKGTGLFHHKGHEEHLGGVIAGPVYYIPRGVRGSSA